MVVISKASCLTSVDSIFHIISFGTGPFLNVPSLDLLDPLFTIDFFAPLQKYSPSDTTASSPKYVISSVVGVDTSETMNKETSWEIARVGMGMFTWGIEMDGVWA